MRRRRERLDALLASRRMERLYGEALREAADCDRLESHARALHIAAASSLGLCEEATREAATADGRGDMAPEESALVSESTRACSAVTDPDALIEEAISSKGGEPVRARALFDRASRALEKKYGRPVVLETTSSPNHSMWPRVRFSPDDRWIVGAIESRLHNRRRRRQAEGPLPSLRLGSGEPGRFRRRLRGGRSGARGRPERSVPSLPMPPVRVFSLPTMRPIAILPIGGAYTMSVGHSRLAVADPTGLVVFDVARGKMAWRAQVGDQHPDFYGTLLAFDASASVLVARESSGTTTIFAAETGAVLRTLKARKAFGEQSLVLTPDGQVLLEGDSNAPVVAWELRTGAKRTLEIQTSRQVTFSGDGKSAAFWGATGVEVVDVRTWKRSIRRESPKNGVLMDFIPTMNGFLAAEREQSGVVSLVDPSGRAPATALPPIARSADLALSKDGRRHASMDSDEYFDGNPIHVGEQARTETYRSHTESGETRWAALSEDASMIALSRRPEVLLLELPSARVARRWPIDDPSTLLFSPDGESLAISHAGGVDVVDPRTGRLRFRVPDVRQPLVAFSPSGALLAIASRSPGAGPLRLLRANGKEVASVDVAAFSSGIQSLVFESERALLGREYGPGFALDVGDVEGGWRPRSSAELDAAEPLRRCIAPEAAKSRGIEPDSVATVTRDCRFALLVREQQSASVTSPRPAPS